MTKKLACPNCGESIKIPPRTRQLVCAHCNESLLLVSNSKLILKNPLPNYLNADQANANTQRSGQILDQALFKLSQARMEKSAQYASERIAQEQRLGRQGLYAGLGTLTAGGLLLLVLSVKMYVTEVNWLELLGMGIGILFVSVGLSITLWFAWELRSSL